MLARLVAFGSLASLAAASMAGPQTFASQSRTINVGVVVLNSSHLSGGLPVSASPYALYNLDQAKSVKPAGWLLANPHAPSAVTDSIAVRWTAATVGTRISKLNAPYWEVFLSDLSDAAVSDYDVLLVAPRYAVSLTSMERERLRRFVDKGGVLWIDPAAMGSAGGATLGVDTINNFPLPFALSALSSGTLYDQSNFTHPLLNLPYALNNSDMQLINGNGRLALRSPDLADEGATALLAFQAPSIWDFRRYESVSLDTVGSQTLPTVSIGRIGDGYVVVTSRGASINLNGGLSNAGYFATDSGLDASGIASAKLAVNIMSLTADFRMAGGGSRKTNSNTSDLSAPLLQRWQVSTITGTDPKTSQPVIYKGRVFVSVGNKVQCFEADPSGGLTPPGGGPLWEVTASGTLSAPVLTEVPDVASGLPVEQLLVTNDSGHLLVINATPDTAGTSVTHTVVRDIPPPGGSSSVLGSPNAPAVDGGLAYVVDSVAGSSSSSSGRIWVADLRSGAVLTSSGSGTEWRIGGSGSVDLPLYCTTPTVAYINSPDNSGGLDKVLYVPFNPVSASLGASLAGFSSVWVGAKGEKPISYTVDTTSGSPRLLVTTRALQAGNLPVYAYSASGAADLAPKLTILLKDGTVASAATMAQYLDGNVSLNSGGQLAFDLKSGAEAWFTSSVSGIRIDYNIDWGAAGSAGLAIVRGSVMFSSSDTGRKILGNLAVSAKGTVFAVYSDIDMNNADSSHFGNGGTVYAFKEDGGRGMFRCVTRYDLYPSHNITQTSGPAISYQTNFTDSDGVQSYFPSFLSGEVQNMVFIGGPCIRGENVYVLAAGQKTSGSFPVDVTVLLALKSEPEAATIKGVGDMGDGITINQPDFLRNPDSSRKNPSITTRLSQNSFKYDRQSGTVRIDNLMGITHGQIQHCLSLSQPVIISKSDGTSSKFIVPEGTGGNWSPLQWYAVLHGLYPRPFGGATVQTTPVAAGDTLYIAGTSLLPKIANTGLSSIPTASDFRGMCYALNINLAPNDTYLVASADRAWNKQFVQMAGGSGNTNILWPSFSGVADSTSFAQRVNQAVLGSGSSASNAGYGIVAGGNCAVAWGDKGAYGFTRADVIVCDQNRVARYDSVGNLLWSSDASMSLGEAGESTVGNVKGLVRPTRAYPIGSSDLLVVDTGGNRVVRMTKAGYETRSISSIRLDDAYRPEGWQANESLDLNQPRDVTYFTEYVPLPATPTFTNQTGLEYWVHYVIADSGNRRLVELVDRYVCDNQGRIIGPVLVDQQPQLGVLLWHSPASVSGAGFPYSSLVRVWVPGSGSVTGHYAYIAGIGAPTPTRASVGLDSTPASSLGVRAGGTGGFVLFDPYLPTSSQVYNTYNLPDLSTSRFWDESTGLWDTGTALSSSNAKRAIGAVNSVTAYAVGNTIHVMVADTTGVYEGAITSGGPSATSELDVTWLLPNSVYRTMRTATDSSTGNTVPAANNAGDLFATYARRLDSGEILLVNGYSGNTRGAKTSRGAYVGTTFLGEVVQLDGSSIDLTAINLGFDAKSSIRFELRGLTSGRGIIMPVYADRR